MEQIYSIFSVSLSLLAILLLSGISCQPSLAEAASAASVVKELPKKSAGTSRANFIVTELDALSDSAEDIFKLAQSGNMDRTRMKVDTIHQL